MTAALLAWTWITALAALLLGTTGATLAMVEAVPVTVQYRIDRVRVAGVWTLLAVALGLVAWVARRDGLAWTFAPPVVVALLACVAAHRVTQERVFDAVDSPPLTGDLASVPLAGDAEVAVIEAGGETRAYPLDYVIHHHVINDRFGDRWLSLTYCAMCRTVMAFDVTDVGPLYVASFAGANMVVGDRRTRTWFQQATAESVIGPLHPRTLTQDFAYQLPWAQARRLDPAPRVVAVTDRDLRAFELPVPGVWRRLLRSETTPGLRRAHHDTTMKARTRVVGLPGAGVAVRKDDVLRAGVLRLPEHDVALVAAGSTVTAFRLPPGGTLNRSADGTLTDPATGARWDPLGRPLDDGARLAVAPASDEYWFSWASFHPGTTVVGIAT